MAAALIGQLNQVTNRLSSKDGQGGGMTNVVPGPEVPAGVPRRDRDDLTPRQKAFLLFEEPDSSLAARILSYAMMGTIVASIVGFILQTEPKIADHILLEILEVGSLIIFFFEYVARVVVCDAFGDHTRCQFIKAPGQIVDLLAIFPTYLLDKLQNVIGNSEFTKPLRVLRAIRLVRVFRIFKLSKYSAGMGIMVQSMTNSTKPLSILTFILGIGILFFSAFVYYGEKLSCPDTKKLSQEEVTQYFASCVASGSGWASNGFLCCDEYGSPEDFPSIVDAFWWSMVTMTTVGYGDKAPKTLLGRMVGCFAMISGIVLISLPVAIVGNKFQQAYELLEQKTAMEKAAKARKAQPLQAVVLADEEPESEEAEEDSAPVVPVPTQQPQFETTRFLEAERMKAIGAKHLEKRTQATTPMSPMPWRASPYSDRSLQQADGLREKLRRLDGKRQLSRAAQGQVELVLELLDNLNKVDRRLTKLSEKDATLDVCLNRDIVALSRACALQTAATTGG